MKLAYLLECFKEGKLGCSVWKRVGSLSVEKEIEMIIARERVNVEVSSYGENKEKNHRIKQLNQQQEQLKSVRILS